MSIPHQSPQPGGPRLWELPCVAIKVFLVYGMRPDTLRAYLQGHCCEPCATHMDDDDWVLRMAHQACHGANRLSNRIEAQLHVRFREQVRFVRDASYLDLVRQLAGEGFTKYELVGLLWALHTDTSVGKRLFGENLLKAMVTDSEAAPPANIIPWPGKLRPMKPRSDVHRWN